MKQQSESNLYCKGFIKESSRVYQVRDLESLSASVFYTGEPCGSFGPALKFGLNTGIARKMSEAGNMVERVRKDDDEPSHLNYEYLVPDKKTKSGKQKWINLLNIHIDL